MSLIDNLQKKSKRTRTMILWAASASVMLVIILIWLFNFSRSVKTKEGSEEMQLPSLFNSIGKDFSTLKQEINASVKKIQGQVKELENTDNTK